jgi:hypothetical protein
MGKGAGENCGTAGRIWGVPDTVDAGVAGLAESGVSLFMLPDGTDMRRASSQGTVGLALPIVAAWC